MAPISKRSDDGTLYQDSPGAYNPRTLEKNRQQLKDRKADTRRKIILGGAILAAIRAGNFSDEWLFSLLDRFVTRPEDRATWQLPPKDRASKERREFEEYLHSRIIQAIGETNEM